MRVPHGVGQGDHPAERAADQDHAPVAAEMPAEGFEVVGELLEGIRGSQAGKAAAALVVGQQPVAVGQRQESLEIAAVVADAASAVQHDDGFVVRLAGHLVAERGAVERHRRHVGRLAHGIIPVRAP